eukprot:scpid37910/ scgid3122/ 
MAPMATMYYQEQREPVNRTGRGHYPQVAFPFNSSIRVWMKMRMETTSATCRHRFGSMPVQHPSLILREAVIATRNREQTEELDAHSDCELEIERCFPRRVVQSQTISVCWG